MHLKKLKQRQRRNHENRVIKKQNEKETHESY